MTDPAGREATDCPQGHDMRGTTAKGWVCVRCDHTLPGRGATPLGEHGRALAERLAEESCSPRVRQIARDLLAEDDAQAGREATPFVCPNCEQGTDLWNGQNLHFHMGRGYTCERPWWWQAAGYDRDPRLSPPARETTG